MNPSLTTLAPITSPALTKTILAQDGFHGSLVTLGPGAETSSYEASSVAEHLLFAVAGEATVRLGDINQVLNQDDALLVPPGRSYHITAGVHTGAKLLRLDVPPRQVITPQILTVHP